MSSNRVVITGMGAISSAGTGVDSLWQAVRSGVPAIHGLDREKFPLAHILQAATVEGDVFAGFEDVRNFIDRFTALGLAAADEAMLQAGFKKGDFGGETAVIIGSGIGGVMTTQAGFDGYYRENARTDPMSIPKTMPSAAASNIGMRYGIRGPAFCISSACASSAQAIGVGMQMVRSGMVERAIVGGAEAMIAPSVMRAWEVLRVLAPGPSRPFSKGRNGMVLGEGAGVLVLELEAAARARGAKILGYISGYGTTSDGEDLLKPNAQGAAAAMTAALEDAGLSVADIGYVNAHGTGTVLNDVAESAAMEIVFGAEVARVPISSTKPVHGHTIGAAGAIELIISVMALRDQFVPPTANWLEADPRCPVDAVPNVGRAHSFGAALTNSFAFGGINASLCVSAVER